MADQNWKACLKEGNSSTVRRLVKLALRRKFPGEVDRLEWWDDNMRLQHRGVDGGLFLKTGESRYFESKLQRSDYPGFCFEVTSNMEENLPGWADKGGMLTDVLCWTVKPLLTVYVLEWLDLKRVWMLNREEWIAEARKNRRKDKRRQGPDEFRWVISSTHGLYYSLNVVVPWCYLEAALGYSRETFRYRFRRKGERIPRTHR